MVVVVGHGGIGEKKGKKKTKNEGKKKKAASENGMRQLVGLAKCNYSSTYMMPPVQL